MAKPSAGELGGAVFRKVEPGGGYTVKQGIDDEPAAEGADAALAPALEHDIYDQDPARGRLRLPRRPATAPSWRSTSTFPGPPRTVPTRPWSSTRATATPTRPGPRAGSSRSPALLGYAVVDVEHARHRLLGRRLRLLRAAAVARRLRRDRDRRPPALGRARQGRDAGHLLRRHQPALRRRHPAAEPRGDHAALGDRQHPDHALSRAGS